MADDLANIKVEREVFEQLRDAKPDGVTWTYFLRSMLESADDI